jgi:hypothetical protein
MKLLVLSAVIGATVLGVLPASAQMMSRDRDEGVVVRHVDRDHDRNWRRHHADCRVVRVRTHLPNGNVIFRSQRTCD